MPSECMLCPFVECASTDSARRHVVVTAFLFGLKIGKSENAGFTLCLECDAVAERALEALNAMLGTELADPSVQG